MMTDREKELVKELCKILEDKELYDCEINKITRISKEFGLDENN
jgi:hypothetical protein